MGVVPSTFSIVEIQCDLQLIYLGRQYPKDPEVMAKRIHGAFMKNKDETDPEKIRQHFAKGEYIVKELEALYMLRKYRTLKRRYYDTQEKVASVTPILDKMMTKSD